MAGRKISALANLALNTAPDDLLPVLDVSEAADADKNKRVTLADLFTKFDLNAARLVTASDNWNPATDGVILVDTTTGDRTITLLTPPTPANRIIAYVSHVTGEGNDVIVNGDVGKTINGQPNFSFAGYPEGHAFIYVSNNWYTLF